jgi:hypothetical protein
MQRLADKGFATMVGLLLFIYARRRYGFTGATLFKSRQALPDTAGATDPVMTC